MSMTPQTERRAIAFIRTIANRCHSCLRRREETCRNCISRWAGEIMLDYEREADAQQIDYSLAARRLRILDAIQRAGRPLRSSEIDLSNLCTSSLKEWTLKSMIARGQLVRVRDGSGQFYLYDIPAGRKDTEDNG